MAKSDGDRVSKWSKKNKRNHVTVERLDFLGIKELFYEGEDNKSHSSYGVKTRDVTLVMTEMPRIKMDS